MTSSEFNQTDDMVERNRFLRFVFVIMSPIVAVLGCATLVTLAALYFNIPASLGLLVGVIGGLIAARWLVARSTIENSTVRAFVTIDQLRSFLGFKDQVLVTYGPGKHASFPWEARIASNNVDLGEVPVNYAIEVQCRNGTVTTKFSARFRPDITLLPVFLAGAGGMAGELKDLIGSEIVMYLAEKEVDEALLGVKALNTMLEKFKHRQDQHEAARSFEQRFGIIVGDITVGEILPSAAIKETMGALSESAIINRIVAESFGYDTMKELEAAITAGAVKVDREELNRRRTQAMAMSGNLQGMDLKEQTFNLRLQGLDNVDPKLVEAIAAVAPAIAAFAPRAAAKNEPKAKSNQPKKGAT